MAYNGSFVHDAQRRCPEIYSRLIEMLRPDIERAGIDILALFPVLERWVDVADGTYELRNGQQRPYSWYVHTA